MAVEGEPVEAERANAAALLERKPQGEALTEKKLFSGACNEEDADLALARVLQEQEKELYFIAYQNSKSAFQEREVNLDTQGEEEGCSSDRDFAARMQQQELAFQIYQQQQSGMERRPSDTSDSENEHIKYGEVPEEFTYEDFTALGEAAGTVRVGVSEEKIQGLKSSSFKSTDSHTDGEEMCAVCRIEFDEDEEVLILPCSHVYHNSCILQWLENNKNCPICKQSVDDDDEK